jgi:hypothetical protein
MSDPDALELLANGLFLTPAEAALVRRGAAALRAAEARLDEICGEAWEAAMSAIGAPNVVDLRGFWR